MKWGDSNSPFKRSAGSKYHIDRRFLVVLYFLTAFSIYTLIFFYSSNSFSSSTFSSNQIYIPAGVLSFFSASSRSAEEAVDQEYDEGDESEKMQEEMLRGSRIAVCLVGGARRFELTGPSIIDKILRQLPNSDLFLNSPLDTNAYKFSLLKEAPKIASIRIFKPFNLRENGIRRSVLRAANSPNGIQGLLRYFHLVEGCLKLIKEYESQHNFTYDWIVRTRVDGYWSSPIKASSFIPGTYIVPIGSSFSGLNDRFGVGDRNTSTIALSRLSEISSLHKKGLHSLNSEASFKAQLTIHNIPFQTLDQPFCVVSDHKYHFPPKKFEVPVAAISSPGPLNGVKCRPCTPVCVWKCVADVMWHLRNRGSWTAFKGGRLQLCDARDEWENGWEDIFDESAGKRLADTRKRVSQLKVNQCVKDFKEMKKKVKGQWDTPLMSVMCKLGLSK